MDLAFGHSNGHDAAAWIEATEFAEVVYRSREVLVVSVATDLTEDELLTGALIDLIATCERCEAAESAIATLAAELDLDVQTGHSHGERHLVIAPRAAVAVATALP
jgi:hypothetical protein